MNYFKEVKLTETQIRKCKEFAQKSSTNHYAKRGQFNKDKIQDQISTGKMGEIVAYKTIKKEIPTIGKPDFKIYEAKNKTWDCDLIDSDNDIKILVKTQDCSSAVKYGQSWIFQYSNGKNRGGKDKSVFVSPEDNYYVCFVMMDVPDGVGRVLSVCSVKNLVSNQLFKDPICKKLVGIKKAIYYKDLVKHDLEDVIPNFPIKQTI
jgi:hypothetical protein